jgi:hypothetical protein
MHSDACAGGDVAPGRRPDREDTDAMTATANCIGSSSTSSSSSATGIIRASMMEHAQRISAPMPWLVANYSKRDLR